MLRKSLIPLALTCLALVAAPALAEQEIIYFNNGTTMRIESHAIEEDTVTVNLGEDSIMSFPLDQIEKIESADGTIATPRQDVNRMLPRSGGATIQGTRPSRLRRGGWEGANNETDTGDIAVDKHGVSVVRPFPVGSPSNKRQFGVAGRRELRNQSPSRNSGNGSVVGTSRLGSRYVLPPKMKGGRERQPVGLAAGISPKTKPKTDNGDEKQ